MATERIRKLCVRLQQRLSVGKEGDEPRWLIQLLLSLPATDSALLTAVDKRRDGEQVLNWFLILTARYARSEVAQIHKTIREWCSQTRKHKLLDVVENAERRLRHAPCSSSP
jgi:hypothetical protein